MPQKFPPETTIDQFIKVAVKEISSQYQVRETKIVPWNQYQAARLIAESTTTKDKIKQLFYAIPQGDIFWLITYSTSAEEFDQRLPSFETSIRNFLIKS